MPDFPGGMAKFYSHVSKNYNYPAAAREQGVSGRLIIGFIVEKDGSLTDIRILCALINGKTRFSSLDFESTLIKITLRREWEFSF